MSEKCKDCKHSGEGFENVYCVNCLWSKDFFEPKPLSPAPSPVAEHIPTAITVLGKKEEEK